MRLIGTIMLAFALAIFAFGRVGSLMDHNAAVGGTSAALALSHGHEAARAGHGHEEAASDHFHADQAGSAGDMNCSSHCCTFACHFVTIDLRSAFAGPDFSYARMIPAETAYLAGNQPLGLDRPPRAA